MSAAVPMYRSDTIFGFPSTRHLAQVPVRVPGDLLRVQARHIFRSYTLWRSEFKHPAGMSSAQTSTSRRRSRHQNTVIIGNPES